MSANNTYDIFISYRRESGEDKARILNQYLSSIGYKVFFDHESGLSGEFETEILAAVEIAPVFLFLMTPQCFERCMDEGDWVRREIERAEKFNKEIIPIRPNYDSNFDNLSENLPDSIRQLSKHQYAEIDFHKNFKATASAMVEEQIKKVVQPSIAIVNTGDIGAKIHFFSDISCRILSYGNQIAVTDADDKTGGTVVRLLKGRHLLEYKSIEHEADAYKETLPISDNDFEDYIEIKLQPIKDKRKEKENALKAEESRKAAEEKNRKEQERNTSSYKYDLFFCYSRKDATIVRQAYQFLTQSGYRCCLDSDSFTSGMSMDYILEAIEQSQCVLYFHSAQSEQSDLAQNEVYYANDKGKVVIPILLDDSDSDFAMRRRLYWIGPQPQTFDLTKRENLAALLDIVRKALSLTLKLT